MIAMPMYVIRSCGNFDSKRMMTQGRSTNVSSMKIRTRLTVFDIIRI